MEKCTCEPGHICDGNRGHNVQGCPQNCPVHNPKPRIVDFFGQKVDMSEPGWSYELDYK